MLTFSLLIITSQLEVGLSICHFTVLLSLSPDYCFAWQRSFSYRDLQIGKAFYVKITMYIINTMHDYFKLIIKIV